MKIRLGKIAVLLFLVAVAFAHAAENLPPITRDKAALDAFFQKVVNENPWLAGTQIANSMLNHRDVEQNFLPGLVAMPSYQELVKKRGGFLTLHVERAKTVRVKVPVISPEVLQRIKAETEKTLRGLNSGDDGYSSELDRAIKESLEVLTQSDPRGILTGLVNCLPKEKRAAFFATASLTELYDKLAADPDLTDQAVKANFRGGAHRISNDQVSRDFILYQVRQLLEREHELLTFLRARWFVTAVEAVELSTPAEMERAVAAAPSEVFDINQASPERVETFFEKVLELSPPAKDSRRKAEAYLTRVEQNWREAEKTYEERDQIQGERYLEVRELPVYLVAQRSELTGDCGTRDDYALIFSPTERNFFVFDANGKVRGYVGATHIKTNGAPTLYVHDITGVGVDQGMRDLIANAFYEARKHFGADRMTLGVIGYAPYSYPSNERVANEYVDADIRAYLAKYCAAPHGDRPEDNRQSDVFHPHAPTMQGFRVRVEGENVPNAELKKPASKKDLLIRLLDITDGGETLHAPLDFLGLPAGETERILTAFRNDQKVNLKDYYETIARILEQHELQLSEKFIGRHENYFIKGHLRCPDAATTADDRLRERTIAYVMGVIRRGQNRELGYEFMAQNAEFFSHSPKLKAYLAELPLQNPENLVRLGKMIQAKISPETIAESLERLQQLTQVENIHLQTWAIDQWVKRDQIASEHMIKVLGQALKNDKHETDDTSLTAAKLLSRFRTADPEVNRSLGKTLARDENPELAYYAGLALLRNGMPLAEIQKLLAKNTNQEAVAKTLLASGEYPGGECAAQIAQAAI